MHAVGPETVIQLWTRTTTPVSSINALGVRLSKLLEFRLAPGASFVFSSHQHPLEDSIVPVDDETSSASGGVSNAVYFTIDNAPLPCTTSTPAQITCTTSKSLTSSSDAVVPNPVPQLSSAPRGPQSVSPPHAKSATPGSGVHPRPGIRSNWREANAGGAGGGGFQGGVLGTAIKSVAARGARKVSPSAASAIANLEGVGLGREREK